MKTGGIKITITGPELAAAIASIVVETAEPKASTSAASDPVRTRRTPKTHSKPDHSMLRPSNPVPRRMSPSTS